MVLRLSLLVFSLAVLFGVSEVYSSKCRNRFSCGEFVLNPLPYDSGVKGDDPQHCGGGYYQFSCEHNNRTVLYIGSLNSDEYFYVKIRDVSNNLLDRIRLLDPGVKENNCSTLPLYSYEDGYDDLMIFVNCKRQVESPNYIDTAPCVHQMSSESKYSYVVLGKPSELVASDIEETCTIYRSILSPFPSLYDDFGNRKVNTSFQDIHDAIAAGYELHLMHPYGYIDVLIATMWTLRLTSEVTVLMIAGRAIIGSVLFFAFLIYKCRRRHLSIYNAIEEFLQHRYNMVPIRYSYSQIKKITNNFKEKLGEGGYGSVYKGKLRSGQLVAVKMLTKSKANNGQDFINEVGTLGRIHHVNVVRLVGFCTAASKSALLYEYMSNGSLDKFIFAEENDGNASLSWNKINEIALGVARGIGYLHEGCNMQILHFDIKPHNILLDENLVPKLSDFGLAKLRQVKHNAVTMTAVRGTLGYMAPELFYKRVGEVSYKVDVYSFGMLLMEMAGRRRNVNANAGHSSQIYFPSWVYDQFEKGHEELDWLCTDFVEEEEKGTAKKLVLIAMWCIQMRPDDRPAMKEVVEMLQVGDSKSLPMLPPRPQFYPPDTPVILEDSTLGSGFQNDEYTESLPESVSIEIELIA